MCPLQILLSVASNILIVKLNFPNPTGNAQIAKAQRSGGLQGRHQQSHTSSVVFTLQTKLATMTNSFKGPCSNDVGREKGGSAVSNQIPFFPIPVL